MALTFYLAKLTVLNKSIQLPPNFERILQDYDDDEYKASSYFKPFRDYTANKTSVVIFMMRFIEHDGLITFERAKILARSELMDSLTVIILADSPPWNSIHSSDDVYLINVNDLMCKKHGYRDSSIPGKIWTSWDKVLFLLNRVLNHFSFAWIIEEDVYIPSLEAFIHLHSLSAKGEVDLIMPPYKVMEASDVFSYHSEARRYCPPPWQFALMCAFGISRRMLDVVDREVREKGSLFFGEWFFPTLAVRNNLNILQRKELSSIQLYRSEIDCHNITHQPHHWYHPVKDQKDFMRNCNFTLT